MTKIGTVIANSPSGDVTLKMMKRPVPPDYCDQEEGAEEIEYEEPEQEEAEEDAVIPLATILEGTYRLLRPHRA